ncbi:hypothetical protein V6N13_072431 [Hibiscus sabdariffa]
MENGGDEELEGQLPIVAAGAAGTRTMGAAGTSKLALGPDRPWSWLGSNFGPFGALFRSATITMKNVK